MVIISIDFLIIELTADELDVFQLIWGFVPIYIQE